MRNLPSLGYGGEVTKRSWEEVMGELVKLPDWSTLLTRNLGNSFN
jgi:hypothetical protein